jgi:hypothetical protein
MPGLSVHQNGNQIINSVRIAPWLFLAMLFGMGLCCFFRVMPAMNRVCPGSVGVMRRLLVMSAFVMFGRFTVVPSSMSMMFRRLLMMFCSLL